VVLKALEPKDFSNPEPEVTEGVQVDAFTIERCLVDEYIVGRQQGEWSLLTKQHQVCECGCTKDAHLKNGTGACRRPHEKEGTGKKCRKYRQQKAKQKYCWFVTQAQALLGDRDTPPDVDIVEVGAYPVLWQAISEVTRSLFEDQLSNVLEGWAEEERDEDERAYEVEQAKKCAMCEEPHLPNDPLCKKHRDEQTEDESYDFCSQCNEVHKPGDHSVKPE
jgi:hypothetical protein